MKTLAFIGGALFLAAVLAVVMFFAVAFVSGVLRGARRAVSRKETSGK